MSVTNITLTGSAMVNWNRRLVIQGVTIVIVVSIHALGHCFGASDSIEGSKSQEWCEQSRLCWEVETLVYSDEAGVYTGWYQGLPQAGPAPLVHIEVVAGAQTITLHSEVHADTATVYMLHMDCTGCIHPEINKHLGLQYALCGLNPLKNLMKYKQHCT